MFIPTAQHFIMLLSGCLNQCFDVLPDAYVKTDDDISNCKYVMGNSRRNVTTQCLMGETWINVNVYLLNGFLLIALLEKLCVVKGRKLSSNTFKSYI